MRRYIVALAVINALIFAISAHAESPEQVYTVGPLTLCRGDLVEAAAYNPETLSRSIEVRLVDFESGRTVDRATTFVGGGRGARVRAGVGGVYVDRLPEPQEPDCREAIVGTVVILVYSDPSASKPVYFSGRFLSARDLTSEQTYGRHSSYGLVTATDETRATSAPLFIGDGRSIVRIANFGSTSATVTAVVKNAVDGSVVATYAATVTPAGQSRITASRTVFGIDAGAVRDAVVELEVRPEVAGTRLDAALALSVETATEAKGGGNTVAMEEIVIVHEHIDWN